MKALRWFVVGGIVGFIGGVAIFRLAADPTDGWADLTSLFGSLFTYGPVGALSGLALARRKRPWPWAKMAFAGLNKPEERADVILYLRSLSNDPAPLP